MKWTYIIRQKVKVAIGLGVVFGLVLITNRMNKNNFLALQDSFSTVYEDRLIAESYIFELSNFIHQKKLYFEHQTVVNSAVLKEKSLLLNDSISHLIAQYETTRLTQLELHWFSKLKENLSVLRSQEMAYRPDNISDLKLSQQQAIAAQHDHIEMVLEKLSAIQLTEARNVLDDSKKIIASSTLTSRLEICILLVVGVIVQGLILASGSITTRFPQNSSLN